MKKYAFCIGIMLMITACNNKQTEKKNRNHSNKTTTNL